MIASLWIAQSLALALLLPSALAPQPGQDVERRLAVQIRIDLSEPAQATAGSVAGNPRCTVFLRRHREELTLGELSADSTGLAAGCFPVPGSWFDDPETWCHARLITPGFQEDEARKVIVRGYDLRPTHATVEQALELELKARAGFTARGKVTPSTKKLWGTIVELVRAENEAAGGRPEVVASAVLSAHGEYALHLEHGGLFDLGARVPGVGTALHEKLQLEPAWPATLPELRLQGAGELRGRLVEQDGGIVGERKVLVLHEAVQVLEDERLNAARRPGDGETGRGCRRSEVSIDAEGTFEITGLEPGRYRLFVAPARPGFGRWVEIDSSPMHTAAELRELPLRTPLIEIQLLDPDGAPVRIMQKGFVTFVASDDSWVTLLGAKPDGQVDSGFPWLRPQVSMVPNAHDGRYTWQVEPGHHYVLLVMLPGRGLVNRLLFAPERGGRVEQTLVMPTLAEPAELKVAVSFPDGRSGRDWSIEILSARTGASLVQRGPWSDREHFTLPAGCYLLRADCDPSWSWHYRPDSPWQYAPYAPVEQEVELRAGEERSVTVSFAEGGRLRFTAEVNGEPANEVLELQRSFMEDSPTPDEPLRGRPLDNFEGLVQGTHLGAGRVELLDAETEPRRLDLYWIRDGHRYEWGQFLPGIEALLRHPLPPGLHRLRFTLPGCLPLEREVEIRAGEVSEVVVELQGD